MDETLESCIKDLRDAEKRIEEIQLELIDKVDYIVELEKKVEILSKAIERKEAIIEEQGIIIHNVKNIVYGK